ncbi:MAG: nickel pincer cofactor biosynthesis protein LarB [Actinobacteria bacterium]|jgi:NCAIR mutase (PurE)-related protein|nr:MAG: nickel pincer cofactor biosynthesis protein LarB [Actinomycetota bacterium]
MRKEELAEILGKVQRGEMDTGEAASRIAVEPVTDLGFAVLDHHRELRKGLPEVVYCEGKHRDTIRPIVETLLEKNQGNILLTRASDEVYEEVRAACPEAEYHRQARFILVRREEKELVGKIVVVTAGTADIPVAEEAAIVAELTGNAVEKLYDVGVSGMHRIMSRSDVFLGANVVVVAAGMEGALPSIVGGMVECPVIAVPTSIGYGANLGGMAALLGMLNSCALGVAVMNIDNGFGAGYFANLINQAAVRGGSG